MQGNCLNNMKNKEVVEKLIEKGISISTIESITGGLLAKLITDIPGSSKVFSEGYVTYSINAKVSLGVDEKLIEKFGLVSKEVAFEMALKLFEKSSADICISTTGNAGPTVCDNKPVGKTFIGISNRGNIHIIECDFPGDRNNIREQIAEKVFNEIMLII